MSVGFRKWIVLRFQEAVPSDELYTGSVPCVKDSGWDGLFVFGAEARDENLR